MANIQFGSSSRCKIINFTMKIHHFFSVVMIVLKLGNQNFDQTRQQLNLGWKYEKSDVEQTLHQILFRCKIKWHWNFSLTLLSIEKDLSCNTNLNVVEILLVCQNFITNTLINDCLAQKRMQYIYSHPSFGDMNYPPGRDCVWNIMGTRKHQNMVLIMDSFEVEYEDKCSYDYLG